MKRFYFILCVFIMLGCSSISYKIEDYGTDVNFYIDNKYIFANKTHVAFNGGFYDEKVKVYTEGTIYFDDKLNTDDRIGLAKIINVDFQETKIYFYDIDKFIVLKEENMKKYKFVNIQKKDKKYYITHTNTKKFYK